MQSYEFFFDLQNFLYTTSCIFIFGKLKNFLYLCKMETTRQQKVNSVLQKDLAEILLREVVVPNTMVSVTSVNITPDMSIARVNLSIFATKDKTTVLKQIQTKKSEIRYLLGERVKNQLRIVPDLQFFIDDSLDRIDRIDELLKNS